jgi:hypothetical protein
MSTINTNGLNVNYPIPGVNNNSQGFRDNFTSIKNNLDIAATEISDLQNKAVLKQALNGATLNNDMANTVISNAATRGFRATTNNLGNALSGTVLINASIADVHYGTVAGNTTLTFGSWAPTKTQSNIQLYLGISNAEAVISFPSEVAINPNSGVTTLENFANVANVATISVPYGVTEMDFRVSTLDCGNTLTIEPINRPRVTTTVQQRTPAPTGFQGDVAGDVAVDASYMYVCTDSYDSSGANLVVCTDAAITTASTDEITFSTPHTLVDPTNLNVPVIFTGTTFGDIVANTVYYVKTIPSSTTITVSETRTSGTAGSTFALSDDTGTMTASFYLGSDIWKRIALTSW